MLSCDQPPLSHGYVRDDVIAPSRSAALVKPLADSSFGAGRFVRPFESGVLHCNEVRRCAGRRQFVKVVKPLAAGPRLSRSECDPAQSEEFGSVFPP
jgi:hypothetical protein